MFVRSAGRQLANSAISASSCAEARKKGPETMSHGPGFSSTAEGGEPRRKIKSGSLWLTNCNRKAGSAKHPEKKGGISTTPLSPTDPATQANACATCQFGAFNTLHPAPSSLESANPAALMFWLDDSRQQIGPIRDRPAAETARSGNWKAVRSKFDLTAWNNFDLAMSTKVLTQTATIPKGQIMRVRLPVASLITVLSFSGAAWAHARLNTSEPADESLLTTSPATISLKFSEGLEPAFSHMTVTGPSGETVSLGSEVVGGQGDVELSSSPVTPLQPGRYVVKWDVLSKDGHKTNGMTTFTVKP